MRQGFTLIELLVVISIIGVLASVILASLNDARAKGMIANAESELRNIRSGIALLEYDTRKWPNGCPPGQETNPEVLLTAQQAGVVLAPTVQDNGDGCEWTASDVSNWDGPYVSETVDSWGNAYHFDPDYTPYENCGTEPTGSSTVAIVSSGPNGSAVNAYDCDDIFLKMK